MDEQRKTLKKKPNKEAAVVSQSENVRWISRSFH